MLYNTKCTKISTIRKNLPAIRYACGIMQKLYNSFPSKLDLLYALIDTEAATPTTTAIV